VDDLNELTGAIIGAAIEVHRNLGPGLLESAYESCLLWELRQRDLRVETQVPVPIRYKGIQLDAGYRIDLLVQDKIIVEMKSVDKIQPIHTAQVLTYLKMTNLKMALILNFNVVLMRSGIKRIINDF
jgi:GxxExxY protein